MFDIYSIAIDLAAMQKRALEDRRLCLDNPAIQTLDRWNSLPDPPESIPDSTGDCDEY